MKSRDGKSQRRKEKRMFVQIALATLTYAVAVRPSSLTMLFMSLSFLPVVFLVVGGVVGAGGRGGSRSVGVGVTIVSFFLSFFLCFYVRLFLFVVVVADVVVAVVVVVVFRCSSLFFVVVGCYYWWWYCRSSFDSGYLFGFLRFFNILNVNLPLLETADRHKYKILLNYMKNRYFIYNYIYKIIKIIKIKNLILKY